MADATDTALAREQIQHEIAELERELQHRRERTRPPAASVLHAYQILLERHYDRLERFDAGPRDAPSSDARDDPSSFHNPSNFAA